MSVPKATIRQNRPQSKSFFSPASPCGNIAGTSASRGLLRRISLPGECRVARKRENDPEVGPRSSLRGVAGRWGGAYLRQRVPQTEADRARKGFGEQRRLREAPQVGGQHPSSERPPGLGLRETRKRDEAGRCFPPHPSVRRAADPSTSGDARPQGASRPAPDSPALAPRAPPRRPRRFGSGGHTPVSRAPPRGRPRLGPP